jgi:hypothetical protein
MLFNDTNGELIEDNRTANINNADENFTQMGNEYLWNRFLLKLIKK